MALRGKKPTETMPRLKALLYGDAGVGKTMAAIQMPRPYIIDTEGGCQHYGELVEKNGGAVFETQQIGEALSEIRSLASEEHPYLTLVVDPFTVLYDEELDAGEAKVGADFERHYGYANKAAKRLYRLVADLDMNVIFTAHAKNLYGDGLKVMGKTFDGWKRLDYLFDLVFWLERAGLKRIAHVQKTRLAAFPDQDAFEWSYGALADRYGQEKLERVVQSVELPDEDLLMSFRGALGQLNESDLKRLKIDKAVSQYEDLADMPAERMRKGLDLVRTYLAASAGAAA